MQLAVASDARFYRTPDGLVWNAQECPYDFWKPYLRCFDRVKAIARIKDVPEKPEGWVQSSGPNVVFGDIPYFIGVSQYLARYQAIRRAINQEISPSDAVLSRSGNCLDGILYSLLRKRKQPYAVQLVHNPHELFAKGAYNSVFRPLLNAYFPHLIKKMCRNASCLTSVSKIVLQQVKTDFHGFCNHYSNAIIPEEAFRKEPKEYHHIPTPVKLLFVGSLANLRKAPDLLIQAVAQCKQSGLQLHLKIIGDGVERQELERLVDSLNIREFVTFAGSLPGAEAVRGEFANTDVFILPSHVEGLPRAMIEAMAAGLPCIGTNASGIPELLEPEDLIEPGSIAAIADKIREITSDPARLTAMSIRNLRKARQEYHVDILQARQDEFHRQLIAATQEGIAKRAA